MNTLKFRAWNKRTKEMHDVKSIHLGTQKIIVGCKYGNMSIPFEDIELMRNVGYEDKNDKEIFEGDVISLMQNWKCVVEYDVENARFVINGKNIKNKYKEGKWTYSSFAPYSKNDFKVIGNIYENPEYVKENNNE